MGGEQVGNRWGTGGEPYISNSYAKSGEPSGELFCLFGTSGGVNAAVCGARKNSNTLIL